jgi:toxin ParE1/3/4
VKLRVSRLAQRDLDEIARYTLEKWGRSQLLVYMGGLLDRLDEVAAHPAIGRADPRTPKRFRRVNFRSHLIFFTVVADEVRIARVLHQRMDHFRHLD